MANMLLLNMALYFFRYLLFQKKKNVSKAIG